jgi:hypothetical protein
MIFFSENLSPSDFLNIDPEGSFTCTFPFKPSRHRPRGALDLCFFGLTATEVELIETATRQKPHTSHLLTFW